MFAVGKFQSRKCSNGKQNTRFQNKLYWHNKLCKTSNNAETNRVNYSNLWCLTFQRFKQRTRYKWLRWLIHLTIKQYDRFCHVKRNRTFCKTALVASAKETDWNGKFKYCCLFDRKLCVAAGVRQTVIIIIECGQWQYYFTPIWVANDGATHYPRPTISVWRMQQVLHKERQPEGSHEETFRWLPVCALRAPVLSEQTPAGSREGGARAAAVTVSVLPEDVLHSEGSEATRSQPRGAVQPTGCAGVVVRGLRVNHSTTRTWRAIVVRVHIQL